VAAHFIPARDPGWHSAAAVPFERRILSGPTPRRPHGLGGHPTPRRWRLLRFAALLAPGDCFGPAGPWAPAVSPAPFRARSLGSDRRRGATRRFSTDRRSPRLV